MELATYGAIVVAAVAGWLPWLVLLGLIPVPVALRQVRLVFRDSTAEELNRAWSRAVQLYMQFGLCMIVGLVIRGVLGRCVGVGEAGAWLRGNSAVGGSHTSAGGEKQSGCCDGIKEREGGDQDAGGVG
jgi:hypothetical protein